MCCSCFVRLPCCAFGPDKLQVQDDAVCAAPFQLLFLPVLVSFWISNESFSIHLQV